MAKPKNPNKCTFPGCSKPYCAKGLCNSHWAQQAKGKDLTPIVTQETKEARFLRQTEKRGEDECWRFAGTGKGAGKGAAAGSGYGQLWHSGKKVPAHTFSWQYYIGPIPDGMQVDHLCRNTLCVNPKHLQLVSPKQNTQLMHVFRELKKRNERLRELVLSLGGDPEEIYK